MHPHLKWECIPSLVFFSNIIYLFQWHSHWRHSRSRVVIWVEKGMKWFPGYSGKSCGRKRGSQGPGRFCLNYPGNCFHALPRHWRWRLKWHQPEEVYLTSFSHSITNDKNESEWRCPQNLGKDLEFYVCGVCGAICKIPPWSLTKWKTRQKILNRYHSLLNFQTMRL